MTTTETHKTELLTRLAALRARMSGIESELDEPGSQDWEDLASERADDEVLEGMGLSAQQEVRMIEAALKRIDDGEYGFCTQCGAPIGERRLQAVPYTPLCHSCAQKAEAHR